MRNKHEIETCTFGFYYINFTRYWPSIIINFFPRKHPNIAACQEMLKWQKGVLSYYYKVSFFRLELWFDFYRPGQTQSPFWIFDPSWHVNIWWKHVTSHFLTLLMEEFLVRMMSCNSPNLFNSRKFPTNLRHIWRTLLWDRVKDWIEK